MKKLLFGIMICLLAGCSGKAYEAEQEVAGIVIKVRVVHSHPILAEYKRSIELNGGKRINFGRDGGGTPFINVFETPDAVILQSFHTHLLVISKRDRKIREDERPLNKEEETHFIGKFTFDKNKGRREYRFIPAADDPKFDSKVLKGG